MESTGEIEFFVATAMAKSSECEIDRSNHSYYGLPSLLTLISISLSLLVFKLLALIIASFAQ